MELGEGISSNDSETESEQSKIPVKIRIAIFYDGTLNNRINVREREADTEIYQQNRDEDGGPSS